MRIIVCALLMFMLGSSMNAVAQNVGRKQDSLINYVDINGMKQGYWLKKDLDGNKVFEGTFRDGEPIGLFKKFHPNGVVKAEMFFDKANQKKVKVKMFDSSGELSAEGAYINKEKDGLWKYYGQKTKLVAEEIYVKGKLHGKTKNYYRSGKIQQIKEYKNGILDGEWKWYYENGKVRLSSGHVAGKRSGQFFIYYNTGAYYIKGAYKNDYKEGPWVIYGEKGNELKSFVFKQGVAENQAEIDRQVTDELNEMDKLKGKFKEPSMR